MIPKAPLDQDRPEHRLSRLQDASSHYSYHVPPARPKMFASRVRSCAKACCPTKQDFQAWARRPALFLVAALLCILITFLVRLPGDARETSGDAEVVQADAPGKDAPGKDAAAEKAAPAKPVTIVEVVKQPAGPAPRNPLPRAIPLEEIAALNAAKQKLQVPPDPLAQQENAQPDPLPAFGNAWINRNRADLATFKPDPVTGAWVNELNQWQLRSSYRLPIDGPEINKVRRKLGKIGDVPYIEQQWWYPQTVEIPEKHWKGKVAKLRFLIAIQATEFAGLGGYLRIVRMLGFTPGGATVMEVDAFFMSPANLTIATAVGARPKLFKAGDRSISRGGGGQLPVKGPEIEAVRKALNERSPSVTIREVKWWPPRRNEETGHETSKLRYEINRNGEVKTEEIVFDYTQKSVTQVRPVNLFPDRDRRTLKFKQARK